MRKLYLIAALLFIGCTTWAQTGGSYNRDNGENEWFFDGDSSIRMKRAIMPLASYDSFAITKKGHIIIADSIKKQSMYTTATNTQILVSNENATRNLGRQVSIYNASNGTSAYSLFTTATDSATMMIGSHGNGRTISRMGVSVKGTNEIVATNGHLSIGTQKKKNIYFGTNNLNRGVIDSNGNWGVGTINPLAKLEVNSGLSGTVGQRYTQVNGATTPLSFGTATTSVTRAIGVGANGDVYITNGLGSLDSRAVDYTPSDRPAGFYSDFKANATDGLADGGAYHGVLTSRAYGFGTDLSGGQPIQIGYTVNGNLWTRFGTGATTWGAWTRILNDKTGWSVLGNTGTTAANFIGTTDAANFVTRTNNVERFRVLGANGFIGWGTTAPTFPIHINTGVANPINPRIAFSSSNGAGNARTWSIGSVYGDAISTSPNYGFTIRDESAGANGDRLVITWQNGYVGIGVSNPIRKFTVGGNGTNGTANIALVDTTQAVNAKVFNIDNRSGLLSLGTDNDAGTGYVGRVFMNRSGLVGINTSTPIATLHLNGSYAQSYRTITATTTLTATDGIVYVNNGATNITITIPAGDGRIYEIIRYDNTSTGTITLQLSGGTIQANGGAIGATTTLSTVAGQRSVRLQVVGTVARRLTNN